MPTSVRNRTDKNGVTPLHDAARRKNPTAVRALLARGALVNQLCRRSGSTPLHRAVAFTGAPGTAGRQSEAVEIVQLLIAAGADPTITNRIGKRPADYTKDREVLKLLGGQ